MNHPPNNHRSCRFWIGSLVIACLMSGFVSTASAYTPDDPVVKRMVDKGIKFLESYEKESHYDGEDVLIAYTHFKVVHDPENPVVKKGLAAAEKIYNDAAAGRQTHKCNYEVPLVILLYAAVNLDQYKPRLEILQKFLFSIQKPHGGFSYENEKDGDLSQSQYVTLAIWTLDRSGIRLDYARVSAALKWILRVQDPSGGWPYMGRDPGPGKPLVAQKRVTTAVTLAGASSLLIAGDSLRIWGETVDDTDPGIVGLPKAIKLYKEDVNVARRKRATISKEPIFRAIGMCEAYRKNTPYKPRPGDWYYYIMYTIERYESFIEIANGRPKDKSPGWYNDGVDQLKARQGPDGGWSDRSYSTPNVSTAFAILFLIRSTQKTIFSAADGATRGGRGFDEDVTKAKLINGKAETKAPAQAVTGLLDLLEKDGADELADKALPENLVLATEPKARAAQFDRLERLVRGSSSWQARRVAARVLGKSDDMRVVPALIFALSDPDDKVRRYARDGLRFISRKFDGYGMPNKPNYSELREAQNSWRKWYITMNPSYVFLDQQ